MPFTFPRCSEYCVLSISCSVSIIRSYPVLSSGLPERLEIMFTEEGLLLASVSVSALVKSTPKKFFMTMLLHGLGLEYAITSSPLLLSQKLWSNLLSSGHSHCDIHLPYPSYRHQPVGLLKCHMAMHL